LFVGEDGGEGGYDLQMELLVSWLRGWLEWAAYAYAANVEEKHFGRWRRHGQT
jgi:hypothetical protein